jgi:hypothetical protein
MFGEYFCNLDRNVLCGEEKEERLRLFLGAPKIDLTEEEQADCNRFLEDMEATLGR